MGHGCFNIYVDPAQNVNYLLKPTKIGYHIIVNTGVQQLSSYLTGFFRHFENVDTVYFIVTIGGNLYPGVPWYPDHHHLLGFTVNASYDHSIAARVLSAYGASMPSRDITGLAPSTFFNYDDWVKKTRQQIANKKNPAKTRTKTANRRNL